MNKIGIDVGLTKIETILTDSNAKQLLYKHRVSTPKHNYHEFISIIKQEVDLVYQEYENVSSFIGMGVPGLIDTDQGFCRTSSIIYLREKSLKADLNKITGYDFIIENDANCFALAEATLGVAQKYDIVMGIIMGTGLGSGLIVNKKIFHGHNGFAGEIGSIKILNHGLENHYGIEGTMESYLCGTGFQNLYYQYFGVNKTSQEICKEYEQKQELNPFLETYFRYFSFAIANLVLLFQPNAIVLGGGLSNFSLIYTFGQQYIEQAITKNQQVQLLQNRLGDSCGTYGAALLIP